MKFIIDNIFWVAIAIASGAMLIWPLFRRGAIGAISTLEATRLINKNDAVVIDVREPERYAEGHILNARNIPLKDLEARVREIERYKNKAVILSCETGNRASSAAGVLKKSGFAETYCLQGGVSAWRQAGLPTEK
jgi:rhodanese-related sulfurtransferase